MARQNRAPPRDHGERWLVSYADFITLLFAFFVVMFATSQVNKAKVSRISETYTAHLRGEVPAPLAEDGSGDVPEDEESAAVAPQILSAEEELERRLAEPIRQGEVILRRLPRGLVLSLREAFFFHPGQDTLQEGARGLLVEIGRAVRVASRQPLRLEGHTDNSPIRTERYPSNWELSAARAIATLGVLAGQAGIAPRRISVAGYGEHRPVAGNQTPQGRAANRRVDIVILSDSAAAMAPRQRLHAPPTAASGSDTERRTPAELAVSSTTPAASPEKTP